jgi:hypothetical protein
LAPGRILPSKEVRRRVYIAGNRYVLSSMDMFFIFFSHTFVQIEFFILSLFLFRFETVDIYIQHIPRQIDTLALVFFLSMLCD